LSHCQLFKSGQPGSNTDGTALRNHHGCITAEMMRRTIIEPNIQLSKAISSRMDLRR
jgi:hypothetical protein